MIVCTASECLKEFEAEYESLETTNIMTALGVIVIARITKAGNCLVAGPATIQSNNILIEKLKSYNCEKIFIDGAFSKSTFATLSDAMIYCVGASYGRSLEKIVNDAKNYLSLLALPRYPNAQQLRNIKTIASISADGEITEFKDSSTLANGRKIIKQIPSNAAYLYIPRAISKSFIQAFIENRLHLDCDLIINNPTSLILDEQQIKYLFSLKQKIYVLHPIKVVAVAYNPYSPIGYSFDNQSFRDELTKHISLPIFNVLEKS